MENLIITPTSVIRRPNLRRIDLSAQTRRAAHYTLTVSSGEAVLASCNFAMPGGDAKASVYLALPQNSFEATWTVTDSRGTVAAQQTFLCEKPREWTFYVMVSSHTDIGLHNSQYIQRYNSSCFIDMAAALCDETAHRSPENQYRYVMEGTWFWNNFLEDRSPQEARRILEEYIKPGKLGVCAGVAGNHTQTFGYEELCRSAYSRLWLKEHGIDCKTMTMIDNNGLSWAMVQPYADAGYENLFFAPNHWNPLPSKVWKRDTTVERYIWNTNAGGGGARCDVNYGSNLPMLFWWESAAGQRLLVWASTQYEHGGSPFGLYSYGAPPEEIEDLMAKNLPKLEEKYPYDIWLLASYADDQKPNLQLCDSIRSWNEAYAYPRIQMLGDMDEPFRLVRERFGDRIPTLRGDITGGWYQHPLSAAELLADKLNTDRALANAEKLASLASLYGKDYRFPREAFNRAWAALIMNDEHSYGTSGYQGRRVYETWIGHRDWIGKAAATASREAQLALEAIGANIPGGDDRVLLFNPTSAVRRYKGTELPAFGYRMVHKGAVEEEKPKFVPCDTPPILENAYFRLGFAPDGAMEEVFDKTLDRRLCSEKCNQILYTEDNHLSFHTPKAASFAVAESENATVVEIRAELPELGAQIVTTVSLPAEEKRIDIDNRILHARDMVNTDRYKRYLYIAFPFDVPKARRTCQLGGCEAEYGVDITGHGTDVYMAAHEYVCVDSETEAFGVCLIQLDSQLVEFDHIHPDKTDFADPGEGSKVYSYAANDWLQMHLPGGSSLDYRFRYAIVSYSGTHRTAGLDRIAEQLANPVYALPLSANRTGQLPDQKSFFSSDAHLVGLKPARDGRGLIARLCGTHMPQRIETDLGPFVPVTIDEQSGGRLGPGFTTLRIETEEIPVRPVEEKEALAIGSVETGLITDLSISHGEEKGMLYLLWGKCKCESLSHYELWRDGEQIATVEPEEYVVGRYVDTGLKDNTQYRYRVRAVDSQGWVGPFSETVTGLTKE